MTWTTEKPTTPGWYWWHIDAVPACIAHIYQIEDGHWMAASTEWEGLYEPHVYPLDSVSINARWYGPMERPT